MFQKTKLSQAISAAVVTSSMAGGQAMAQDANVMEEVYVQGIRGSLERAMDIKRDSAGVVDAISAEDIGKFPDSNLAESLQRITGVSINRRNGEGNQITVRGFGPQFNLVLLNGRHIPATQVRNTKTGGSNPSPNRSFDMSNLAAEGVSGVEVYKSSNAALPSGGIGATVNLKTRRPFDNEGFTATVGAKALSDSTNRAGDDITPEFSTFVSWSNDMFGASLAYTSQERHSARSGVFSNNWSSQVGDWEDASMINSIPYTAGRVDVDDDGTAGFTIDTDGDGEADFDPDDEELRRIDGQLAPDIPVDAVNVINEPNQGQLTHLTDGIRYFHEDRERERENMQATFQFRPIDDLTLTLDHTQATQEIFSNGAELSFWYGGGTFPTTDVQFDQHPQVRTSEYIWLENPTGVVRDLGITQNQGYFENEISSTGLNVEWDATDELSFEFDHHNTESESLPGAGNDTIGSYYNIALGAQGVWAFGYDNSGDLPLLVGVYGDDNRAAPEPTGGNVNPNPTQGVVQSTGNVSGELDIGDLGSTVRQGWHARSLNEIQQTRIQGSWDFSDTGTIDFGVETRSMEATQTNASLTEVLEGNWGVGTPGDVPPEMMEQLNYADLFDGYRTSLTDEGRAFFDQAGLDLAGGNSGQQAEVFTTGWIAKDVAELGRHLSSNAGLDWAPAPSLSVNRTIEEDIDSFFLQVSNEFDLDGMPLRTQLGIRHENTDVKSIGQVAANHIDWQGDNDIVTNPAGAASDAPVQIGLGSYSHTLPNLSLALNLTEDLVGRFAYSKSISRPSYGNQLLGINNVQAPNGGPTILGAAPGTANNGNPDLRPLESTNYDLSVEWYYGESSYASIGYFYKDVPNFIGTAVEEQIVPTTRDQTAGPRAQAAIDELNARNIPVNQQSLFQMVASMNLAPEACETVYNEDAGENASNSATCGDPYSAYTYEGTTGWEDNIDLEGVYEGDPSAGNYLDPLYTARVRFPVDNQEATLDGWEFAVQHFFGETGFGVQANYTIVNGDVGFDITADPTDTQFALTGLSDSANLVFIYEKFDWSTRLAYNWRDEFLVTTADSANEPRHTEAYEQWDLNVSYNITDQWSASFEAINLTGEDQRDFARTKRQLLQLNILDTRYALGVRYEF